MGPALAAPINISPTFNFNVLQLNVGDVQVLNNVLGVNVNIGNVTQFVPIDLSATPNPLDPDCPQLYGTGEILMESAERASGYWTTRADKHPEVDVRTAGVYWRADPEDMNILDGREDRKRAELIAERLRHWKSIKNV